ncbi:MAG: twin-arginine translocase subunit TatC, partial [Saccharolobus sp.]
MVERTKEVSMEERPLIEHLRELAYRLKRIFISLAVTFLIYFMIGIQFITTYVPFPFFGLRYTLAIIPIPFPSIFNSISVELTQLFIYNELPKGVQLLIINLFDPL